MEEEPLTSHVRPPTDAVLTIRIIKSFPFRNVKNHILTSVDLKNTTPLQLFEQIKTIINTSGAMRPYRNVEYDSLKVYTRAHGSKSMNLVINFDHDDAEWLLMSQDSSNPISGDSKSLWDLGIENETELSVFNWAAYQEFKANPEEKW
ncbi:altered inheritance rate of mitochondria protein 29 [[Candida] anglica]|uniref:Altered inheritance rate of mitochondria protein 29 n=1 Tax=[Candida] anglica TaxID=148631 RepID=A0ABP0E881_9ASCO